MKKHYDKLIRDRIPEIMDAAGVRYEVRVMGKNEYRVALRAKVLEEAGEVAKAAPEKLAKEIGDLLEGLEALMEVEGIGLEDVRGSQRHRRHERGGFAKQIRLVWTESSKSSA